MTTDRSAFQVWGDAVVAAGREERSSLRDISLEQLLERSDLGQLPISDAQRAVARAAAGQSVELPPEKHYYHFGRDVLPVGSKPRTVLLRTGVRAGKSLISGLAMIECALNSKLRWKPESGERAGPDGLVGVRPGEAVRCLVVAPTLELTRAPMRHIKGSIDASPVLSRALISDLTQRITLRRPDGITVEISPVAASAAGTNLRSTWLAGVLFDEADFHDSEGAAVNLLDNYRAVVPRILRGGQIWIVSSPWDDASQFNELFSGVFGEHNGERGSIAFHSDSVSMNPTLLAEDIEAERARDPENAAREYDAVPRSSSSLAYFPASAIATSCVLPDENLPPNGAPHWAGADLGVSKNSAVLALARAVNGKTHLAFVEELIPSPGQPLSPKRTCRAFAKSCVDYAAVSVKADHYNQHVFIDEISEIRTELGRPLGYDPFTPSSTNQAAAFAEFRRRMVEGLLVLPRNPRLIRELKDAKMKKITGGVGVQLASHGASHSDLLMAVVLACIQVPPRGTNTVVRRVVDRKIMPF